MGANASSRLLSPDEATGMLGPELSRRVEEGFSHLTLRGSEGGRGGGVDQRTFHRHVLEAFPGMPTTVAKLLFDAFDLTCTGGGRRERGRGGPTLAMEDFLCVAAVLLKGTWEQRLKLGFRVYEVMGEKEGGANAYRSISSSTGSSTAGGAGAGAAGGAGAGAGRGIIEREDVERLMRQVHGWAAQRKVITPALNLLFTDHSSPSFSISPAHSPSSSSSSSSSTSTTTSSSLLSSIDFPSFHARLTRHPAFQPTVVGWMEEVLMRALTDVPSPRLLALDLKYNPEREMKQLANKFQVGCIKEGGKEGGRGV